MSCSNACRSAKFGNRIPQLSFEVVRAAGELEETSSAPSTSSRAATEFGYDTQRRHARQGGAATPRPRTPMPRRAATDWTRRSISSRRCCPNLETGLAGRRLVRQRSALRRMHDRTPASMTRPRRRGPRSGRWPGSPAARRARSAALPVAKPAYRRHALRRGGAARHRGSEGARACGLLLSVPLDGHSSRQFASRSLLGRRRAAGVSVARPHHLFSGARRAEARPTRRQRPPRRSTPSSARPSRRHFRSSRHAAVSYSGPAEWSFRRLVLHYAKLCQIAGGVDVFLIGSELRGADDAAQLAQATIPFVAELVSLAAEVKAILARCESVLCRRLERIFRPSAR